MPLQAEYLRAELAQKINNQALADVDALVVPTSPTIHTLEEMKQEPIRFNSQFGTYTNFTNLADLSALALPAPLRDDGLPAGITLIAPAWHDRALADFVCAGSSSWRFRWGRPGCLYRACNACPVTSSRPRGGGCAHLRGMPLNFQLTTRDAAFVEATHTAPNYRLYALANTQPQKPGIARDTAGAAIEVELWDIPLARFGEFVEIPAPLGIGSLELSDGRWVKGFICEPAALNDATDITEFKGWRHWIARKENRHV
jgi:allophanate hydrolase